MKKIFVVFAMLLCVCGCNRKEIYLPAEFDTAPSEEIFAFFPCLDNGFSMLLEVGVGKCILIGCGTGDDFPVLYEFLRGRKIESLETVILLSDNDENTGGFQKLSSNFAIGNVYAGDGIKDLYRYKNLCLANAAEDSTFYIASEGTRIYDEDGVSIDVISSRMCDTSSGMRNAMSLYITYYDTAMFIEGDGDFVAERDMLSTMGEHIEADVITVPHSGASDLPSAELLSKVKPRYAVMPVYGDNYPLRRLTKALEQMEAEIIRTDTDGTVVFTFDGKNVKYNIVK